MGLKLFLVPFIVIFLFFPMTYSEDGVVKQALVRFMDQLAVGSPQRNAWYWGWNLASDPCTSIWQGVTCSEEGYVEAIVLDGSSLYGTIDFTSLCKAMSLQILSLNRNSLHGFISKDIGACKSLTHLYLSENNFSGDLPSSLGGLENLHWLHVANNKFTGELPNMVHVPGLISLLAENNKFSGEIPDFDFSKLMEFNVSNNNLEGLIPDVKGKFQSDSFSGNRNLCGNPLPMACPPTPPKKDRESLINSLAIYSGYALLALIILFFFAYKLIRKFKAKKEPLIVNKEVTHEPSGVTPTEFSFENKSGIEMKSEYSMTSLESEMNTSTLVVLSSPGPYALRFEDILRAPAELVGRGMHGSLYKVWLDNGVFLAVKRIRDWGISNQDFERRMNKISQVKHPYVMSPVVYYCSRLEKLLAYEYMENGSLFKMLHGSQSGQSFDWGSRLSIAANIADALAYMHEELRESGIAHGNIKSNNILFSKNMDPCISEYGLMVIETQAQSALSRTRSKKSNNVTTHGAYSTFKVDVYAFGVILLELLTGKVVQENSGFDLAQWVNSVVREEWTVEVFDKHLISQGASEERMVNMLQVAFKCINPSPDERPSMIEVAAMTISLKEEDDRSSITF
ncbi:PREDICTED: probable inactive receptor kinase At2g26730 [Lupinus angustifolius]|nr:PREDICTED: probable inactive receptor kinase At2g26730 [Lupinus angustifolius]